MASDGAGRSVVNALTVDVEDYFHAEALAPAAPRERWDAMPSRVVDTTQRVLDLFARHGVRGTFFVLGWVAQRHPELVRRIAAAGHEVACHGMTHRLIYRQTPDAFRDETRASRALLQDLSGQPVHGYRAASFSITRASLWALDEIAAAGFRYDSSIFPVRHDTYGIPGAPTTPYRIATRAGELVEVPLSTVTLGGLRLPASGGGYFRLLPEFLGRFLLGRVNAAGRPFVFYMHPWEVDPDQPRQALPLRSRLRHYTNLDRFEARLDRLLVRFAFDRMDRVLERAEAPPVVEPAVLAAP